MVGILGFDTYLPYGRLRREAVSQALGVTAGGGTRTVAGYDEDTTTLGVEASRALLRSLPGARPDQILFATTNPAYLDKTNATTIHAALALSPSTAAFDCVGSIRAAAGALALALGQAAATSLVVLSDIRTGLPRSAEERDSGDGAAALLVGAGTPDCPVLAELIGRGSATREFLDRWKQPGASVSKVWDSRFGEQVYPPLAEMAATDAFKEAGLTPGDVDRLVVTGPNSRAARRVVGNLGVRPDAVVDDLKRTVGFTGAAHPGIMLAAALEAAKPGDMIALVVLADGADVFLFRATPALAAYRPQLTVTDEARNPGGEVPYAMFLTWRGLLSQEPARRPEAQPPAAPPSLRSGSWKFAFVGSRCTRCSTAHVPPQRVCVHCSAVDQMTPEPLADVPARVTTFTLDHLADSLSPPVVAAVIDFDRGGRFQCEMTDVNPANVQIGLPVEMTFRRLSTSGGVHNYFWKARPARGGTH